VRHAVTIVLSALLCTAGGVGIRAQEKPIVAAAADLKFALEDVADRFAAESGVRVTLVFGSSGHLTRQVIEGAPFELFLSADESYVERLAQAGLTRDHGTFYALGYLVVFAPHGSALRVDERLEGVREWLETSSSGRFAIANPEHAPYGRAAQAALRALGLWDRIEPRLVLGENVAQAAQFATTGGAAGGIIAYSLALAPPMKGLGTYARLSASLHPPLRQRMVLLKRAGDDAVRFYEYLQTPEARDVLRRYGFAMPDV
jgi:molybdate transport system substrate-binding protein